MISQAKIEDLNSLYDIEKRVFKNDSFALSKASFKYHILKNKIFKMQMEEKTVGYILWLERKEYFRLYSLAIDENFQGLGIASKLLEFSFKELKNKNYSLEVKVKNEKAVKLYEKFGFKIKKVLKNYYEDSDGYLMVK
jgi:[ribosomal protein S18]-alanine N-acetyltransferase